MSTQFQIDWESHHPVSAQIGMAQADSNADPRWKHWFDACVMAAARKKPEITSDDVIAELSQIRDVPTTHNLAAIGPAMQRAWDMGIIEHTDRVKRSEIKHKRGNLHTVWLSKVFEGEFQKREDARPMHPESI